MAFSFLQANSSTADLTTYTFSGESLGAAVADRYIIVAIVSRDSGSTAKSISTVTIGGVSAEIVAQRQNNASNSSIAGMAIALVPTGTTGDVVVTFSEAVLRCHIGLYRATGINQKPADVGTSIATNPTYNIRVPMNGFAIGVVCNSNGNDASVTWTGLTETYDTVVESVMLASGAAAEFSAVQTNLTLTATIAGTNTEPDGVFASWGLPVKTTTIVPSSDGWAGVQSSTGDTPAAFSTYRALSGSIHRDQGTSSTESLFLRCFTTTNQFDLFRRALFSVSLATIPRGSIITSAYVRLYVNVTETTIANQFVTLCNGGPAADTDIVNGDFGTNLNNNTQWGDSRGLETLVVPAYNLWNLNSTGISALQAAIGGYFKFQLKFECDRTNTAPTWTSGNTARMGWNFGNAATNKSELVVAYSGQLAISGVGI